MKTLFLIALALTTHATTAQATGLRQLITHAGSAADYQTWLDLEEFRPTSPLEAYVAITEETVSLCYEPGKKKRASQYLSGGKRFLQRALVTEEGADILVKVEVNYSFTEFSYSKLISECSLEWIAAQYSAQ